MCRSIALSATHLTSIVFVNSGCPLPSLNCIFNIVQCLWRAGACIHFGDGSHGTAVSLTAIRVLGAPFYSTNTHRTHIGTKTAKSVASKKERRTLQYRTQWFCFRQTRLFNINTIYLERNLIQQTMWVKTDIHRFLTPNCAIRSVGWQLGSSGEFCTFCHRHFTETGINMREYVGASQALQGGMKNDACDSDRERCSIQIGSNDPFKVSEVSFGMHMLSPLSSCRQLVQCARQ